MSILRKSIYVLLCSIVLLVSIVLFHALSARSRQLPATPATVDVEPLPGATARFQHALRFRTITTSRFEREDAEFIAFRDFLRTAYPRTHQLLDLEILSEHSMLYRWQGSNPSLKPVVLMGHYDVVDANEEEWQRPPFGGEIVDGEIWGRGALDDKSAVIGILEAVEALAGSGFRPDRTILLSFGHDEEQGGRKGAYEIAKLLQDRDIRPEMVLDEGGAVTIGMFPLLQAPLAAVAVAEKGFLNIEVSVRDAGGHSSTPPQHTAIGRLAAALALMEANPLPYRQDGVFWQTLEWSAPEATLGFRALATNLWLTRPLLLRAVMASDAVAATLRTTQAITVIRGGMDANVLPDRAEATVNYRVLPGDSDRSVLEHLRRVVPDTRVEFRVASYSQPPAVSPLDSEAGKTLQRAIKQIFPEAVIAPIVSTGAQDARHFTAICPNVYRFSPLTYTRETLRRIHGKDERVEVEDWLRSIRFYAQFIENAASR